MQLYSPADRATSGQRTRPYGFRCCWFRPRFRPVHARAPYTPSYSTIRSDARTSSNVCIHVSHRTASARTCTVFTGAGGHNVRSGAARRALPNPAIAPAVDEASDEITAEPQTEFRALAAKNEDTDRDCELPRGANEDTRREQRVEGAARGVLSWSRALRLLWSAALSRYGHVTDMFSADDWSDANARSVGKSVEASANARRVVEESRQQHARWRSARIGSECSMNSSPPLRKAAFSPSMGIKKRIPIARSERGASLPACLRR